MYELINEFSENVLNSIPPKFVEQYEWLLEHIGQARTVDYQRRYRSFWAMNRPVSNPAFYDAYFEALSAPAGQAGTLGEIVRALYLIPPHPDGPRTLQFSFATKLMHTRSPHLPVYDSQIAAFYFFEAPSGSGNLDQRIKRLVDFYEFLIKEYARVLKDGLLATAIGAFRRQRAPQHFTDERIVDSLIWPFVRLRKSDDSFNSQIAYS
jgi:hypothetical protein